MFSERVTLGDGFSVTEQVAVAGIPQLFSLVVVKEIVSFSVGMPEIVSLLYVKPAGSV